VGDAYGFSHDTHTFTAMKDSSRSFPNSGKAAGTTSPLHQRYSSAPGTCSSLRRTRTTDSTRCLHAAPPANTSHSV